MLCMSSNMTPIISESAQSNIDEIELDAISSSQYFKPRAGTTYVIRVDIDQHKIKPVENERFKDAQGKPLKRYQFKLAHVNNGKEAALGYLKNCLFRNHCRIEEGFYGVEGY